MSLMVPCAKQKDKDELSKKDSPIIYHDFDGLIYKKILAGLELDLPERCYPEAYIQQVLGQTESGSIKQIINTLDYPGCFYAAEIARQLNCFTTSMDSIMRCQHKYYSRIAQQKYASEATPQFAIVRKDKRDQLAKLSYPFFIKPVKAYLSVFAQKINSPTELDTYLERVQISDQFLLPFNWAMQKCETDFLYDGSYFIAEELLQGEQVTLEGFVHNDSVGFVGIVDSKMIPGTISFERFIYPSALPKDVQKRMRVIAEKLVLGIELQNSLFNIEFMYDQARDDIKIIEINARLSSQFADLFRCVNGWNNYDVLYDIAYDQKPNVMNSGEFQYAASLVGRQLEDQKVISAPTPLEIEKAREKYPELYFYPWVSEGMRLSDVLQDGVSFVYCWIHLGANSLEELQHKYDDCKKLLPFQFEPIS